MFRSILYGDATNSAKDADVIALFIMDIHGDRVGLQVAISATLCTVSMYIWIQGLEGDFASDVFSVGSYLAQGHAKN